MWCQQLPKIGDKLGQARSRRPGSVRRATVPCGLQHVISPGVDHISLLSPVLHPSKVICLGLNYRDHAAEAGMAVPEYPVLFHKVAGSLIGHNQPIVVPRISSQIDYEGELAIIMGRRGKYIAEDEALSYVAGYQDNAEWASDAER